MTTEGEKRVFTQVFCVITGLIEQNGKFLLVRENQPKNPDHGKWNLPSGWLDVGEHPIEGVKREVLEETGFDFTPVYVLGVYSFVRKDLQHKIGPGALPHGIRLVFAGTFSGTPQPLSADVSETKWFMQKEIEDMDSHTLRDASIKDILRDYSSGKRYPLELITHSVQQ